MIIFHEGMPRSGKSYAAMADHIIPSLKKGRRVYARLDGLDFEKIAQAAELDVKIVAELLTELSEDDCKALEKYSFDKDALIVLDELQNYWPQKRAPLNEELTKWIAEHGHHGWDVLCMGQVLKDCHRTWMNRTNRKIQFQKKDVVGKANEYKWTMYSGKLDGNGVVKFVEVTKGDLPYDPKYFGCYKSHSEGTENTENYEDSRVNIFNSPIFKKWLPIFGGVFLLSVAYIIHIFSGGMAPEPPKVVKPVSVTETVTRIENGVEQTTVKQSVAPQVVQVETKPEALQDFDLPDLVGELSKDNRIRLAAVVRNNQKTRVVIEWRDSSKRVVETMETPELELLGWQVMTTDNGRLAILASPSKRFIVTAWPVEEAQGKVTNVQNEEIKKNVPAGMKNAMPGVPM